MIAIMSTPTTIDTSHPPAMKSSSRYANSGIATTTTCGKTSASNVVGRVVSSGSPRSVRMTWAGPIFQDTSSSTATTSAAQHESSSTAGMAAVLEKASRVLENKDDYNNKGQSSAATSAAQHNHEEVAKRPLSAATDTATAATEELPVPKTTTKKQSSKGLSVRFEETITEHILPYQRSKLSNRVKYQMW